MPLIDQLDPDLAREHALLDRLPPEAAYARAEELLRQAQASGSFVEEFVARRSAASTSYFVPNDPHHLVHFVWLRQAIESHPEIDDEDRWHVLWVLKWAVSLARNLPQVPLADIEQMVDDLERVHRGHGYGARPALRERAELAELRGDDAGAAARVWEWLAVPRDRMSDCEACEISAQAGLMQHTDPAWALEHVGTIVARGLTCHSEPYHSLATAAELELSAGKPQAAAEHVAEAWRLGRDLRDVPGTAASVLTTFTRLGNVDRALAALLPRLDWLDGMTTAGERLAFLGAAALVLEVGLREGLAPEEIDGRPTTEIAAEVRAEAEELAAAFDARNGSSVEGDRLRDRLDLGKVARTPTMPPLRVAAAERGKRSRLDDRSIAERAAHLRQLLDDVDDAVPDEVLAWNEDRERALAAASPDEDGDIAFLDRLGARALPPEEQAARLAETVERAERAGDDVEARRSRAALLQAQGEPGDPETAGGVAAIAESLEADERWPHASAVWARLAEFVAPDLAEEAALRAAHCSHRAGEPVREALALCDAARAVLVSGGDPARAEEHLTRADQVGGGHRGPRGTAYDLRWRMAANAGDLDRALALLREACADPDLGQRVHSFRLDLCDLLVDSNQIEELTVESDRLLADAVELRDPGLLALAQRFRGLAHVERGEYVEGSELLESALPVIRERAPWLTGPAAWALGNALTGLSEWAAARTAFATAALGFEAQGRGEEQAHAQFRAGDAAWDGGDTEAARAHLQEAVELATAHQVVSVFQRAARGVAALRGQAGELDAGIADLDRVPADAEALARAAGLDPPPEETAGLRRDVLRQGAYLLAEQGQPTAAVQRLRTAEAEADDPEEVLALRAAQGQFLAEAGDLDAAAIVLRATLPQLTDESLLGVRIQAASRWATALDEQGRTEEADQVWAEFGPDA